ncbi:MAG: hypothetical protein C4K60_13375 [Ideonella sp. MAG2]|nr:MAG: hypothetical protein C4K60_13375 [Ideonella sp. MAG2]
MTLPEAAASTPAGAPGPLAAERNARNRDLDPQLVWRGKDQADWSDLVVNAPPLYIQEKVHPKVLIDDLKRQSEKARQAAQAQSQSPQQVDLFADMARDFNGLPDGDAKTEFYAHDQHWSNRLILGDSLQVMASLAEREGLRGKVQCIYFDPPYGIKFNSNFQWSTTSRDVKDGNVEHITREPEMVKAFRDTWKDGIHSYLGYIRDRLTVARDLLTDSGSIFVQIGDENVHRVRAVMDEVFGDENIVSQIAFRTTTGRANDLLPAASNYLIWATKDASKCKFRTPYQDKSAGSSIDQVYSLLRAPDGASRRMTSAEKSGAPLDPTLRVFTTSDLTSSRSAGDNDVRKFLCNGRTFTPGNGTFKSDLVGLERLRKSDRFWFTAQGSIRYVRYYDDFPVIPFSNVWTVVFIGPEFGTVSRPDLVSAAREAAEAGFDVLIACAFNYDAHSSEFNKLGKVPVLKARMNADLHMAEDLKNTGKGNLFVIFGEPDIDLLDATTGRKLAKGEAPSGDIQVKVNGVDVFHPNSGEVRSDGAEGIACWFIDTDYNEESFFVRHAYFLGASDPYKSLKTTLKAEINAEAWESLNSDTSRPFGKPGSGRIAVKVINHLGDEVMKVFKV